MDKLRPTLLEKSPIILEIGSLFTKIGIADESFPKRIIYTPQNLRAWLLTKDDQRAGERDIQKLEHDVEAFIRQVFIYELLLNPRDRAVTFCENTFMPQEFVQTFAKVLLTRFSIPKVLFFYSMILPMYTASSFTGIVVDCGYQDIQILPIYEGYPVREGFLYLPGGGKQIAKNLKECLLKQNLGLQEDVLDDYTLEDIKVKHLNLLLKNQKEQYFSNEENIQKMKNKLYTVEIDKKKIKISYYDKTSVLEGLFGDPENEETNIAASILDSVSKVNVSARKKVTQCIVLSGGITMIPNFAKRMRQELSYYLGQRKYENLKNFEDTFSFGNVSSPSNCLTWIGAAILSNLSGNERFAATLDSEGKIKIPDRIGDGYLYAEPTQR